MFTAMFWAVLNWLAIEKKGESERLLWFDPTWRLWGGSDANIPCPPLRFPLPFSSLSKSCLSVGWHIQICFIWFVRPILELIRFSSKFIFVGKLPSNLFFWFSSLDNPLTFPPSPYEFSSPLKVEKLLWWNTERGWQHALRWSFINQSAVWSPSSISHHRCSSVQKVARAKSEGSTIYLEVYMLCASVCMGFLLTSECIIVHWFMNLCFHDSCMHLQLKEKTWIICQRG